MAADLSSVGYANTRSIVQVIRASSEPAFKAEIARLTRLSIPTVIRITDDLIAKGLIRSVGKGESTGGKPPQLLVFAGESHEIIGVDLATDFIRAARVDLDGKMISTVEVKLEPSGTPGQYLDSITGMVRQLEAECRQGTATLLGVGIAMPGIVDPERGMVTYAPDLHWEQVDFLKPLQQRLHLPVMMENDSRAKAIGEMWHGLGKGIDDFICINYGYGIGAALAFSGTVRYGQSGIAGEFGHMILDRKGPRCDCGNYGCVEALASGQAISRMARQQVFSGAGRYMLRLAGSLDRIHAETVFLAAEAGDAEARDIVEACLDYLGLAIANLVTLLDPSVIILNNYYVQHADFILPHIQKAIDCYVMKKTGRTTRLVMSQLGDYDGAIGASAVVLNRWAEFGFNHSLLPGLAFGQPHSR